MKIVVFIPFLLVVAALLACGRASVDQLKARAAFDLQCPESTMSFTEIDGRTFGVRGCGQQATYVENCSGSRCTWVLNADSRVRPR